MDELVTSIQKMLAIEAKMDRIDARLKVLEHITSPTSAEVAEMGVLQRQWDRLDYQLIGC